MNKKNQGKSRISIGIFSSIFTIFIIGMGMFFYSVYQTNHVTDEQVKPHLKNNTLRLNESNQSLLFDSQEIIDFKVKANQVTVTMAHYKRDKLEEEKEMLSVSAKTGTTNQMDGTIQWGIMDYDLLENQLRVAIESEGIISTSDYTIKIKTDDPDNLLSGVVAGLSEEEYQLEKNIDYQLAIWAYGEDGVSVKTIKNGEFSPKDFKKNKETFVLYATFK